MNVLLNLYPGHWFTHHVLTFLAQSAALIGIGLGVSRMLQWNAASRYQLLLATWLAIALLPFASLCVQQSGLSWITSPYFLSDVGETSSKESANELDVEMEAAYSGDPDTLFDEYASTFYIPELMRATIAGFFLVWLCGGVILLIRLLSCVVKLQRAYHRAIPYQTGRIESICRSIAQELGIQWTPPVVLSSTIGAPGVLGYLQPKIVIPKKIVDRLSEDQLRQILLHETAHIIRRDPWFALAQKCLNAVLWPHPLLYLLNRAIARAREEVCDNYVLNSTDCAIYGRTLVDLAEVIPSVRFSTASIGLLPSRWLLEERVTQLINTRRKIMKKSNPTTIAGIIAGAVLITAVFAFGHPVWGGDKIAKKEKAAKVSKMGEKAGMELYLEQVQKKLQKAVEAGELTQEEADKKFQEIKQKNKNSKKIDIGSKEWKEGIDFYLKETWKKLQQGVEEGKLTKEEAAAKFEEIKKHTFEKAKAEQSEKAKIDAHLKEVWAKLQEGVEAGKLTKEEAAKKFEVIKQDVLKEAQAKAQQSSEEEKIAAYLEQTWAGLQKEVDAGNLTMVEAKQKMDAVKKEISEKQKVKLRMKEKSDAYFQNVWSKLNALVEKGELTKEDAAIMLGALKNRGNK